MNKKTLIKVCAVTCGLGLTLAGCTSSNNSNEINNTKKYNTEINSQDTEKTGSKEIINKKIDENLYIDATLQMPETQLNEYNTKLKDFNLKDIMAYLYPDIKESDLVKDDGGQKMKIEDARKIIQEESLQGYNLCEERENRENEVVLKKENEKWIVYVTDERASKITNSVDKYNTETEAIEDFIERLRADKVLCEL